MNKLVTKTLVLGLFLVAVKNASAQRVTFPQSSTPNHGYVWVELDQTRSNNVEVIMAYPFSKIVINGKDHPFGHSLGHKTISITVYGEDKGDTVTFRGSDPNTYWVTFYGGKGDDKVFNKSTVPLIAYTGEGNDTIEGCDHHTGLQMETLNGGPGVDTIKGNGGHDHIEGGSGSDLLFGGPGDDHINGNEGNDSMWGGKGEDTLIDVHNLFFPFLEYVPDRSLDLMHGGPDKDTFIYHHWGTPVGAFWPFIWFEDYVSDHNPAEDNPLVSRQLNQNVYNYLVGPRIWP